LTETTDKGAELYLDLLKLCLTRLAFAEPYQPLHVPPGPKARALALVQQGLARWQLELVRQYRRSEHRRRAGRAQAETMIGLERLSNVQACVTDVLRRGIPGDLIETGAWRGGACIFMRAIWVADSFRGLPAPSHPVDTADIDFSLTSELAVPVDEVPSNFARYGLLDDQVSFLEGYFSETLPNPPIDRLAVLRLDGDMYESTIVALESLYPKLSQGGYLIVDDYGAIEGCRRAVDDYRAANAIIEAIVRIDHTGVYWRRAEGV
jgi:O-methyltransferase